MTARTKSYLLLLVVSAIWGIAGPVIKYTLNFTTPLTFLAYRFFLTSVFLIPIYLSTRPPLHRLSGSDWVYLALTCILGSSVQLGLLFWGFSYTSSIEGTIISATSPILVAIAGSAFLHEQVTKREKLGNLIAFAGSLVIVVQPLLTDFSFNSRSAVGNLLILLAGLAWVAYVILSKIQLRERYSPIFLTTCLFFFGFISIFPVTVLATPPRQLLSHLLSLPPAAHLGVLYMSLISGALAYFLYQKGQKSIETSEANLFTYLSPVFALPLSYFWLGEPLTLPLVIGSMIIAAGVFLAETRPHNPVNRQNSG